MHLFAFFGLWTTIFVGSAALSVPVVIHLLNRRRYRIVTWAAMRFLLLAQKQNTRRMRLEQLLLLLCRVALIACILLAMASVTPWAEAMWSNWFPDIVGHNKTRVARIHHVIVLDGSLSMNLAQADDDTMTIFDRARELAIKKINDAPAGDGFSVLLMKEHPAWVVSETSQDGRRVAAELASVTATHGNASIPTALGMVAAKLADNAKRFPAQRVYFFTDMQRASWATLAASETAGGNDVRTDIGSRAKVVFIDVGRNDVPNRAVTDLRIDDPFVTTGMPVIIKAVVHNFGNERKEGLAIKLMVGQAREKGNDATLDVKQEGKIQSRTLAAGEAANVQFTHTFTKPGTYAVQVRIEADKLPADDVRTIIVMVKDTVPVLLVNGKPAPERFDQGTEYLRFALDPGFIGKPLRPRVVSPQEFLDLSDAELLGFDAMFFCDVGKIGDSEMRRLKMFLRLGSGIVFSAGEETYKFRDVYKKHLYENGHGLLPGYFTNKAEDVFYFRTQDGDFAQPPLSAFKDERDKFPLHNSRFRNYLETVLPTDTGARTIMTYQREEKTKNEGDPVTLLPTGHPALLEYRPPLPRQELVLAAPKEALRKGPLMPHLYRGRVLLFTSTLNMDWTTWPASTSFLPMMQEVVRVATAGKLRPTSYQVGNILEEYFANGGLDMDVEMVPPLPTASDPDGRAKPQRKRTRSQGDFSVFRWPDDPQTNSDVSGIYVLNVPSEVREYLFAVNPPTSTSEQRDCESDLARIEPGKLKDDYKAWDLQVVADPRNANLPIPTTTADPSDIIEQPGGYLGPIVAHGLLLAALAFILLEIVLAWAFGRFTTVAGVASPPAVGLLWPLVIGVVCLSLFVGLAFVRIHASRTGDFLGFLPETMRQSAERFLKVPSAPPGENSRWDLESRPDLFFIGYDFWPAVGIVVGALCLIFYTYRADGPQVSPIYKILLAGLRMFLLLFVLAVLLPQLQLRFDRQGWPDLVLIIDDTRSMGEPDSFTEDEVKDRARVLGEFVKKKIKDKLPARIADLKIDLEKKRAKVNPDKEDGSLTAEIKVLEGRLKTWQNQLEQVDQPTWAPSRLQLVQSLLAQPEMDWLDYLVHKKRSKLHIYHLDAAGRAIKIVSAQGAPVGEITEADPQQIADAHSAVAQLEAEGNDSRLGTALRQVIDQYRGSALSAVIMCTDGVTTRDETIQEVADYSAQKGVPLFFVGIGDDHEVRDLRLHDLQVEDQVRVNDMLNFQAKLTGKGLKDMVVPVILKVKEGGKEIELTRQMVKVDEHGKSTKFTLRHRPKEKGRKLFIVEVETPKKEPSEKLAPGGNRRLERNIDVLETNLIKVLLVDGTARYDFRFLKSLLEREIPDDNRNRSMELKVLLLDADPEFWKQDNSALADFPATTEELAKYDVVVFGDCQPDHPLLGTKRLKNLASFVRGDNTGKPGGGILFVAGSQYNPHAYKGTPLADILPIKIGEKPAEPELRSERFRLAWTPSGKQHQIFKFGTDDMENQSIWHKLPQLYWWSSGYTLQPAAEVLAVHETIRSAQPKKGEDPRHPLIVQQFVGSGRSMFFGFDESWRWRLREDEDRYNTFWIQTIRYLSRLRVSRTDLRLQQQTPFRRGEQAKVTVRFPDNHPLNHKDDPNQPQVKVNVEFTPTGKTSADPETKSMTLVRSPGGPVFEGTWPMMHEGKYRFYLSSPDVRATQPGGENPNAEATVEMPPGELEKLRLNRQELTYAAETTQGGFYTLANAENLLADLPEVNRPSLSSPRPPILLWNNALCFLLVLGLVTAEWILRKRKHLL